MWKQYKELKEWKNTKTNILKNISSNNQNNILCKIYNRKTYSKYQTTINNLLQIYKNMNNIKYLELYKKIHLKICFPRIKDIICNCGSKNINDIFEILHITMTNQDFVNIIDKSIKIYKTEECSLASETDFEFLDKINRGKVFFWDSYPRSTNINTEPINGIKIYIPFNNLAFYVFYGFVNNDTNKSHIDTSSTINEKINIIQNEFTGNFYSRFIDCFTLRDWLINDLESLRIIFKNLKNDLIKIQNKNMKTIQEEFQKVSSILRIKKYLLLLLCSEKNEDNIKGNILYENLIDKEILPSNLFSILQNVKDEIEETIETFENKTNENSKEKIILLDVSNYVKQKLFEKLKEAQSGRESGSKAQQYIDGILKVPFGKYINEPIFTNFQSLLSQINNNNQNFKSHFEISQSIPVEFKDRLETFNLDKNNYLNNVDNILNQSVHGHHKAKTHIKRLIAQWIHGKNTGSVFGFQGPPGTGKTTLAKEGFSKCLIDSNGNSRPFAFLPIGGSSGSSFLEGHGYTYMGSSWGRIVDILIEKQCMNPVIYIDELDKISNSDRGQEIIGILIHLTDPSQNKEFHDKYFSGIDFDLSQAIIVFSYNDSSKIDKVLLDRITEINIDPLSINDKITISKNFLIPQILNEVGLSSSEIQLNDTLINYIIDTYTNEAGVRKLKEIFYMLLRDINYQYLINNLSLPFQINNHFINSLLLDHKKNIFTLIPNSPCVGKINGLYASTSGIGGLTIIETYFTPSDTFLSLELTGSQGDVMKESMRCAKTLAWNLLSENEKNSVSSKGLHIHCPAASTAKDGPSAGCAITIAIYSRLLDKQINNKVALTGEIDLNGNITAIGGIDAKLFGALRAGVQQVLIPYENKHDLENFLTKNEDFPLTIHCIKNIHEALSFTILT